MVGWHYYAKKYIDLGYLLILKDILPLILKDILPYFLFSVLSMLVSYFILMRLDNLYLLLFFKLFLYFSLYAVTLWLTGSVIFKECLSYLVKRKY